MVWEFVHSFPTDTVIVSGGAKGVDDYAETAAKACGMAVDIKLPQAPRNAPRNIYVAALMARNTEIVRDADLVTAFWDGSSNGTRDSLKKAHFQFQKPIRVFLPAGEISLEQALELIAKKGK